MLFYNGANSVLQPFQPCSELAWSRLQCRLLSAVCRGFKLNLHQITESHLKVTNISFFPCAIHNVSANKMIED